jgi:hypothetical protein
VKEGRQNKSTDLSVAPNKNYCHLVEYVCERSDKARKQRSLSIESAEESGRGSREGEREEKCCWRKSGAFFFYLVPRDRFVLVGAWGGIFSRGGSPVLGLAL